MATVLVKGGLVYDGSGEEPVGQDILIKGDRIVRLGNFSKNQAQEVIDATGAMVVPGFIDVNSSFDRYLRIFKEDWEENYIRQGVTTVLGGNCGVSLAPLFGTLVLFREWADISKVNVNWHTIGELKKHLERIGLGINFGTLVGHSTVRRALVGEAERDLTESEMFTFKKILKDAFRDGAFGLSFGLEFVHSRLIPSWEIEELVKTTAEAKRVSAFHLRSYEEGIEESFNEVLRITEETGANVEISHLKPRKGAAAIFKKILERIEEETAKLKLNFDCDMSDSVAKPIYQFLPPKFRKGNLETMLGYLNAPQLEKELIFYFRKFTGEDIYLESMPRPLSFLAGRTLKNYADNNGLTPPRALLQLMRSCGLRGVLSQKEVERELFDDFIFSPSSLIAGGEGEASSAFIDFIKLSAQGEKISLEKAIAKITALPQQKFKLKGRGKIDEGFFADLVILRDLKPVTVIVNGKAVLEEGKFKKGVRSGCFLKCDEY